MTTRCKRRYKALQGIHRPFNQIAIWAIAWYDAVSPMKAIPQSSTFFKMNFFLQTEGTSQTPIWFESLLPRLLTQAVCMSLHASRVAKDLLFVHLTFPSSASTQWIPKSMPNTFCPCGLFIKRLCLKSESSSAVSLMCYFTHLPHLMIFEYCCLGNPVAWP